MDICRQKGSRISRAACVAAFVCAGVVACWGTPAFGDITAYLQNDVRITGDQIHHYTDAGKTVTVVVGDFLLQVGPRQISGQDAVVWIDTSNHDRAVRHAITVYVEGDARVIEPGRLTRDKYLLVKLKVQGRISAKGGTLSTASLKDVPFYARAKKTRAEDAASLAAWREKIRSMGLRESSQAVAVRRSVGAKVDSPDEGDPARGDANDPKKAADVPPAPPRDPDKKPAAVRFRTPGGIRSKKDAEDPTRRITVATGKIYLAQGDADSDSFMEMQADRAVIFTRAGIADEKKDELVPYAPPVIGLGDSGEKLTGVYLEGDVILTRGERRMTATRAFYDFTRERALVLEPVLRTVQEQRNVPFIIRADKARMLNTRESKFYNAKVSTSEFHTPTYSINAAEATLIDDTPYDSFGDRLGERSFRTKYVDSWWDVRGVPLLYSPEGEVAMSEPELPIRRFEVGRFRDLGYGVKTQWDAFRLLGLLRPEGVSSRVQMDIYEKGMLFGIDTKYQRREKNRQYSGYFHLSGVYDAEAEDTFGDERQNIPAPNTRGRMLARHKEFLPGDWEIQGELSLMCDRNYLEEFYPNEYWAGKKQENLLYAKKQRDNWAFTALLKARLNRFLTQNQTAPEVAGYLIGQPLLDDHLTYFGEARLGAMQYVEDNGYKPPVESDWMARFDMRHELDLPLEIDTPAGPLNFVPFVVGRMTYWSDRPGMDDRQKLAFNRNVPPNVWNPGVTTNRGGDEDPVRFFGQIGARANMNFWRVYNDVESRLWDVHRLKHTITPELLVFTQSAGGINPDELYPMTDAVENRIRTNSGFSFGLYQRLQTKRGPVGNRRTVDWMRFNAVVGFFHRQEPRLAGDGRFFFSRPEYSLQRDFLNLEYIWNVSDSATFMADMNYDLRSGQCSRINAGLSVQRDPRFSYYLGARYIKDLDSAAATMGFQYRINKKFSLAVFEQFDLLYRDGVNLGTRVTLVRKYPRWHVGLTFTYDQRYQDEDRIGFVLNFWPDGVPELGMMGGNRGLLNQSSEN